MRSIWAVVLGLVIWLALWLALNAEIMALMPEAFDSEGRLRSITLLVVLLVAAVLCSLAAGGATAKVSRGGAARNVIVLAAILLTGGLFVEISYWALLPVWYHLIFLVLLAPATIVGGRLAKPAA